MDPTKVNKGQPPRRSFLFTLRLWAEDLGDGRTEWRGQVQHVLSGETRYFRNWHTLLDLLLSLTKPSYPQSPAPIERPGQGESGPSAR